MKYRQLGNPLGRRWEGRTLSYLPAPGEIVLQYSTSGDPMSAFIRYRAGSKWSHVDAVCEDGDLIGARAFRETTSDGLHTYRPGVQKRRADYHHFTHALRIKVLTDPVLAARYYALISDEIGKSYDFSAIWGFALDRDWRNPERWFCDELVLSIFEKIHFWAHCLALPLWRIDPGGSQLVLSTHPTYCEIEAF